MAVNRIEQYYYAYFRLNNVVQFPEGGQARKHCFLAMFTEGSQTRKHCFLAMFTEGRQTRKHCFLAMFSEGRQTRKTLFRSHVYIITEVRQTRNHS